MREALEVAGLQEVVREADNVRAEPAQVPVLAGEVAAVAEVAVPLEVALGMTGVMKPPKTGFISVQVAGCWTATVARVPYLRPAFLTRDRKIDFISADKELHVGIPIL